MNEPNGSPGLDIAVVGLAGRFPRARNVRELWDNLKAGVESISSMTDEELAAAGVGVAEMRDPNYVRARGIVDDSELFDASLFGFSPREARIMDPQQRVFLECAWEALDAAACDPERFAGSIGVYAGTSQSSYAFSNLLTNPEAIRGVGSLELHLGNDKDFLAALLSYRLNLQGPSITVSTACSTSLVAVHLACQALLNRECDLALAGGVSIRVPQKIGYRWEPGGIASADGHCRAFDAAATGSVAGNGAGIVVLKRLDDALADGSLIHAVIRGSAVNNDGSLKIGFTAPSVEGQAAVITEAQAAAGVDPESISYVEAHGSGTRLGDPVEVRALTRAFRAGTEKTGFCRRHRADQDRSRPRAPDDSAEPALRAGQPRGAVRGHPVLRRRPRHSLAIEWGRAPARRRQLVRHGRDERARRARGGAGAGAVGALTPLAGAGPLGSQCRGAGERDRPPRRAPEEPSGGRSGRRRLHGPDRPPGSASSPGPGLPRPGRRRRGSRVSGCEAAADQRPERRRPAHRLPPAGGGGSLPRDGARAL
jgi:3-oxoacyl-(acyl-carrier-protein) synthase